MFRIRRILDDVLPANHQGIEQVQQMLREQLPGLKAEDIEKIPDLLRNPVKHRFRSILYVAEGFKQSATGFALLSYEPNLRFCFLDYISAARLAPGRGIGGALYSRVREEATSLNVIRYLFRVSAGRPESMQEPGPAEKQQGEAEILRNLRSAADHPYRVRDSPPPGRRQPSLSGFRQSGAGQAPARRAGPAHRSGHPGTEIRTPVFEKLCGKSGVFFP
jgi:hypothetical protein